MRYKRLDYMCTNNKCCQIVFYKEGDKISTICPYCGSEMIKVGEKWTSTETEARRQSQLDHAEDIILREKIYNPHPTVTCPYCKRTNTHKISGVYKAASIGLFGLFAVPGASKQYTCKDCGADF